MELISLFSRSRRKARAMKSKKSTKRIKPDSQLLDWREDFLLKLKSRVFEIDKRKAPLLEAGNSKIGTSSENYSRVLVWNLPAVKTCPSASKWCLKWCYNADLREEKFPHELWNNNLHFFLQAEELLKTKLLSELRQSEDESLAVRIHSSGDFFSCEYISFWIDIIKSTPNATYWAYTRSWSNDAFLPLLEELKNLKNIQLFASWDRTMKKAPEGWRLSYVYQEEETLGSNGIICPEQSGKVADCATCNYCLVDGKSKSDVYFIAH